VRENRVEAFNGHLRSLHLHPRQPGQSASADMAKAAIMRAWGLTTHMRRHPKQEGGDY
jgi:hypothetical protein